MKLTVIIPTYNRVKELSRALNSVMRQKLPKVLQSLQLIVVDDGSTDETSDLMARKFPQVEYLKQDNSGVSAARNAGLKLANGEWIAFLDSDDEWLPDKLYRQFELLEQTGLLVCHTQETWIRNGVKVNQMDKHQKAGGWIFERCLPICAMSPSSIVIHRSVFEAVGMFDESLPACEDYDLWLRISARFPVAFVEQASINKYGGHKDQLSRKYWGMDRFRVKALKKILGTDLPVEMNAAATEVLIRKLNILLKGAIKHKNQELKEYCHMHLAEIGRSNEGARASSG